MQNKLKKIALLFLLTIFCLTPVILSPPIADATIFNARTLTGGTTTSLDGINGRKLKDGDRAIVLTTTEAYFYWLDADSGATDNGSTVIAPDSNAGDKRWLQLTIDDAISTSVNGEYYLSDFTTIAAAETFLNLLGMDCTLIINEDETLVASVAFDAEVTLQPTPGNVVTGGAYNLTAYNIDAGPLYWFNKNSTGNLVIPAGHSIEKVYPQWWGAVADGATDDGSKIQNCFNTVLAIASGPKPVIKLVGNYAYTGDLYTRLATDTIAYGVVISGEAGGRRGDAAVVEGMTTLTNIGAGAFYFGRLDDVTYRPWMLGSTLENIQFVGNANVAGPGLWTAANCCVFRNIHVTGYTKATATTAIGWARTGEINSYYDCSTTNNYDGSTSERGGNASASNNLNNYYSCTWNANTRYGDNVTAEDGPNYYGCLWQLNGAEGYRHRTAGDSVNFWGGWFEGNNSTTAGYQCEFLGTASGDRALNFNMQGTVFGGDGGSATAHFFLGNTTNAKVFPSWIHAAHQFANGGNNYGLAINQPNTYTGTERAPYIQSTSRTAAGTRATYVVGNANLAFDNSFGFGLSGGVYHYPDTNDTGAAYGFMTSSKRLDASSNTTVFLITFDQAYGQGYFTFTYTDQAGTTLYNGIKSERHIRCINGVSTISVIGTDDLRGSTPPAIIWTNNGDSTVTIRITNNNAATTNGHAVIEGRGGGSSSGEGKRGFSFGVL